MELDIKSMTYRYRGGSRNSLRGGGVFWALPEDHITPGPQQGGSSPNWGGGGGGV